MVKIDFDVTWLILQGFSGRELKPMIFLVAYKLVAYREKKCKPKKKNK